MIPQEMEGLKKTIEEQKKIIEEKQKQCEEMKKTCELLEKQIKESTMNVCIIQYLHYHRLRTHFVAKKLYCITYYH